MTTPRKLLEDHLATDNDVETSLRGRTFFEGRLWVLNDTFTIGDTEQLEVIVAVSVGNDLETLMYKVWSNINALDGFQAVGYAVTYGGAPIAGRKMAEADYVSVEVSAPFTPEDSAP